MKRIALLACALLILLIADFQTERGVAAANTCDADNCYFGSCYGEPACLRRGGYSGGVMVAYLHACEQNFPDAKMREQIEQYAYINDQTTGEWNILSLKNLYSVFLVGVQNVQGLKYFPNLGVLQLYGSEDGRLSSFQPADFPKLTRLEICRNRISVLDVAALNNLRMLKCFQNELETLNVSANPLLNTLYAYGNHLAVLDVPADAPIADASLGGYDNPQTIEIQTQKTSAGADAFSLTSLPGMTLEKLARVSNAGFTLNAATGEAVITRWKSDGETQYVTYEYDTGNAAAGKMVVKLFKAASSITLTDGDADVSAFTCALGSLAWRKANARDTDYRALTLTIEITSEQRAGATRAEVELSDGFSFLPDRIQTTKTLDFKAGSNCVSETVYPIFVSANDIARGLRVNAGIYKGGETQLASLSRVIPIERLSTEGKAYYPPTKGLSDKTGAVENALSFDPAAAFTGATNAYSAPLSKLGVLLSMAAYDQTMVEESLANFGFSNVCYHDSTDESTVACAFAQKKIRSGDEVKTVLAVVVRGTVGIEWRGNLVVNGYMGNTQHAGFMNAANWLYKKLQNYIDKKTVPCAQTAGFVCGHSRGAAVANNVAHRMNQEGLLSSVYAYTFATPNTTKTPGGDANIFNHIHFYDVVGYVPNGYTTHGVNMIFGKGEAPVDVKYAFLTQSGIAFRDFTKMALLNAAVSTAPNQFLTRHSKRLSDMLNQPEADRSFITRAHCAENYVSWVLTEHVFPFISFEQAKQDIRTHYSNGIINYSEQLKKEATVLFMEMGLCFNRALHEKSAYRLLFVRCPVDVEIADSAGVSLAKTSLHSLVRADSARLEAAVEGEADMFILPCDAEFGLKILGRDAGEMDIDVFELDADMKLLGTASFENVPIAADAVFSMRLPVTQCANALDYLLYDAQGNPRLPAQTNRALAFPEDLTRIEDEAYANCEALSGVLEFPMTLQTIGAGAFRACPGLQIAVIPACVTEIGEGAFEGCGQLVIWCAPDSYAKAYADANRIPALVLNAPA